MQQTINSSYEKKFILSQSTGDKTASIPFDSVIIDEVRLIITAGEESYILSYSADNKSITYNDIVFDSIRFESTSGQLSLLYGETDCAGNITWGSTIEDNLSFIEWHQNSYLKYADKTSVKTTSCNHLYGAAFNVE